MPGEGITRGNLLLLRAGVAEPWLLAPGLGRNVCITIDIMPSLSCAVHDHSVGFLVRDSLPAEPMIWPALLSSAHLTPIAATSEAPSSAGGKTNAPRNAVLLVPLGVYT